MAFNMSCITKLEAASNRDCSDATTPCGPDEVPFNACPAAASAWPCSGAGCDGAATLAGCNSGRCRTYIAPAFRPTNRTGVLGSAANKCCYSCYDTQRPGYRIDIPGTGNRYYYDMWVQLMWGSSTRVGCGFYRKPYTVGQDNGVNTVCAFYPSGPKPNGNYNIHTKPEDYATNIGVFYVMGRSFFLPEGGRHHVGYFFSV